MTIETAILSKLTGFAGLAALVSGRVHPVNLPQKSPLPAVSYQLINGDREHAMGSDPGIVHAFYQFDCWAESYLAASAVRAQVLAALKRWRQSGPPEIFDAFVSFGPDLYEGDTRLYHHIVEATIHYREA